MILKRLLETTTDRGHVDMFGPGEAVLFAWKY